MEPPKLLPMARKGTGCKGETIQLLANHFRVSMGKSDFNFYQYDVAMSYEDGNPMEVKGTGRKVLDEVKKTYDELKNVSFAYDGEKGLFTLGRLQKQSLQYIVVLEDVSSRRIGKHGSPDQSLMEGDAKRMRRQSRSKTIKVDIKYVNKFPMQAIANALRGNNSDHFQDTLRVLDIILRQHAANQGCLLVRQSFFHDSPSNYTEIGGGVIACRGIHSSFRATQGGLSLNVDVSNTMIVKPGPVLEFLLKNQNAQHLNSIDWNKAKRMLKNLRIKANGIEFKISGLSDKTCRNQTFVLRQRDENDEVNEIEITVYDYFKIHKKISLLYSADMPCINVGKPKRPSYFPIELCVMVSLQRYTKALTILQRTQLVERTRQKPQERQQALQDSIRNSRYGDEPMLRSSGIIIDHNLTKIKGRVLQPPKLVAGNAQNIFPQRGRWNFNNKMLFSPVIIDRWAIVNFSCRCNIPALLELIRKSAIAKGMNMQPPYQMRVYEEDSRFRRDPPHVRVEKMYAMLMRELPSKAQFLLCILPERKNCDIYGPWKRKCLVDEGIVTQCISPQHKLNDQYITNVMLKINAKFGGMNSFLTTEYNNSIPYVSDVPTLILGMDVSHGSPGQDVPSIAAVVSSKFWPQFSCYRATVRTQSSKLEMIQSLFKPVSDTKDDGIIREVLVNFSTQRNEKPQQIIIFRDGVSESQFNQVLNIELSEIIKACKHYDENWKPKFTVIIAQKNHHTRFFQANASDNVPPGTVIDNIICDPKNNDFYLCAQAGMIGTTRPIHYHVLHDEIGFTADQVQELVHSLSYTYQRSTTAVSLVAPVCYAHLAAAQMAQLMKFDEHSQTSSSHGGLASAAAPPVPPLPDLHEDVKNTMFFC